MLRQNRRIWKQTQKNNREKQRFLLNSAVIKRYFSRFLKRLETLAREPPSPAANALLRAQQKLIFKASSYPLHLLRQSPLIKQKIYSVSAQCKKYVSFLCRKKTSRQSYFINPQKTDKLIKRCRFFFVFVLISLGSRFSNVYQITAETLKSNRHYNQS